MAWEKALKPKKTVLTVRIDEEEENLLAKAVEKSGIDMADFLREAISDRVALTISGTPRDNFLLQKVRELDKENLRMKRRVQEYAKRLLDIVGFTGGKVSEV